MGAVVRPVGAARAARDRGRRFAHPPTGTLCGMNEPVRCRVCDLRCDVELAPTRSWTWERHPEGKTSWLCADCTREVLRAIETRLSEAWW